jgi:hypothetical protein
MADDALMVDQAFSIQNRLTEKGFSCKELVCYAGIIGLLAQNTAGKKTEE